MFFLSLSFPSHNQPSSLDYGFDFDKHELGREFFTTLPACFSDQSIDQVEAKDFKRRYR